MNFRETIFSSPLGNLRGVASDDALFLLEFEDSRSLPKKRELLEKTYASRVIEGTNPLLTKVDQELKEYFEGKRKSFSIPLHPEGTEFQKKAWKALEKIPYGETRSYKEEAISAGNPKAVRAIGGANNKNPIVIIIPCHRVIGADGSLTGYGGGMPRKEWLLALEK